MNGVNYLWLKAGHVIAVIAWYAGLFYIFRLFVYHVQQRDQPEVAATLAIMERRLLRAIMLPAAVLSILLGVAMLVKMPYLLGQPWMHAKLGAIAFLLGYHALAAWVRVRFAAGDYVLSERACRILNEVPTVLLFIIVIAVIVRP
ncbi:MAG: protoporphyrinogen oxidase HemJ [Gemmatimonadetes bacterium]|nr:protoporphyrinogen oxidase HemJ [Gemmatimonadota bacterium]MCB9505033.1 protoporphyrinogen oxidase HemJ [Gemmatimonadales bacterium]MCA9762071.1 protoporphyrinogen oxidase HemJ [Gemmatimonadota bacterium]MCA9767502.1 protoporphyrinogen oxidase HemJ [Gemmatimonadota bacterium]MCB9517736.1 protoporphyrinogen oxidase HemJ [Gemmatimonadales bacterium]